MPKVNNMLAVRMKAAAAAKLMVMVVVLVDVVLVDVVLVGVADVRDSKWHVRPLPQLLFDL